MTTSVDICNQALSEVGGNRITSIEDGTTEARQCKVHYQSCLEKALSERFWTFATGKRELAQTATSPEFEHSFAYQLPSDCIVVRSAGDKSGKEFRNWVREGDQIHCDEAVCFIQYTKRIADPQKFSPMFESALVYLLASRLAIPIAASRTLKKDMYNLYRNELYEASPLDGRQGSPKSVGKRSSSLIRARFR